VESLAEYKGFELERGLWYAPYGATVAYTRVFTVGGTHRVAEIGNYPRAYRDTNYHLYDKDTEFTVLRDDYYTEADDAYYDRILETYHHEGGKAIKHVGESLPGSFPRWIEYPTEQSPVSLDAVRFRLESVPKPMRLQSVGILGERASLSEENIPALAAQLSSDQFVFPSASVERALIYIHYQRRRR